MSDDTPMDLDHDGEDISPQADATGGVEASGQPDEPGTPVAIHRDIGPDERSERILLRAIIEKVADALEKGLIGPTDAAASLREAAAADADDLDEGDIEIDLDESPDEAGHPGLLAMLGMPARRQVEADPVEAAISEMLVLRDRIRAHRIIGDTPSPADTKAYRGALARLGLLLTPFTEES